MGRVEDGVKELISERYGSVPKFADAIGLPAQTVYSALRNGLAGASATTVMPITAALGIDPYQLTYGNLVVRDNVVAGSVEVPLFGSVSAGQPTEPDYADALFPIPAELHDRFPEAFLLKVDGESMNRVLPNGCYALINPCDTVNVSNKPYAVAVGDARATIKRVRVLSNGFELCPDSSDPTYRSLILDFGEPDAEPVSVIGQAVWYCLPPNWDINGR